MAPCNLLAGPAPAGRLRGPQNKGPRGRAMNKQTKFVVGALIVIVSLGWLAWVGAKESKTYYHTIAELSTPKGAEAHHRMRVGGTVRAGSIARYTGRVDFVIEGEGKALPVSYTGSDPLPGRFGDDL